VSESDSPIDSRVDRTFESHYLARVLSGPVIGFPTNTSTGDLSAGFEVCRDGEAPWYGVIEGADGCCRLYTCPNPSEICIHARDTVYIINVGRAREYAPTQYGNIKSVTAARDAGVLVLATETNIITVGKAEWRSPRLCLDELAVLGVRGMTVLATGWDPSAGVVEFQVDLGTREQIGYSSPIE
jgi:hypothetical protein